LSDPIAKANYPFQNESISINRGIFFDFQPEKSGINQTFAENFSKNRL
jgi:hypothetical protein